jgi:hypothetical protein
LNLAQAFPGRIRKMEFKIPFFGSFKAAGIVSGNRVPVADFWKNGFSIKWIFEKFV